MWCNNEMILTVVIIIGAPGYKTVILKDVVNSFTCFVVASEQDIGQIIRGLNTVGYFFSET